MKIHSFAVKRVARLPDDLIRFDQMAKNGGIYRANSDRPSFFAKNVEIITFVAGFIIITLAFMFV